MAGLEDLAALLVLGDKQKQAIAESDPYSNFAQIGTASINNALTAKTQSGGDFSAKDRILGAALSGLFGGAFGGMSDDYRARAGNAYLSTVGDTLAGRSIERPDVLSPSIFSSAQQQGNLFKVASGLRGEEAETELRNKIAVENVQSKNAVTKTVLEGLMSDDADKRTEAKNLAKKIGLDSLVGEEPEPIATKPADTNGEEVNPYGFDTLEDRRIKKYEAYKARKFTDTKAAEAAQNDLKAELEADKKSFAKVDEARAKANDLISLADTTDNVLQQGVNTGALSGVHTWASRQVGGDQATNADLLNSIKSKVTSMSRISGSGSTSDFDAKMYIQSGPGLDKTEDANREIARRMRQLGERERDYADFVDTIREAGGTIQKADELWSKYTRANPLWIKTKDGVLAPNENIERYDSFFANTNKTVKGESAGGGLVTTPTSATQPNIPQGAADTGRTSGGRPVYQLPDGRLWVPD